MQAKAVRYDISSTYTLSYRESNSICHTEQTQFASVSGGLIDIAKIYHEKY